MVHKAAIPLTHDASLSSCSEQDPLQRISLGEVRPADRSGAWSSDAGRAVASLSSCWRVEHLSHQGGKV